MTIKLSEIFDNLVYGEFSKLSIGEDGSVTTKDYNRLITHINLGISELFKRFSLKHAEVAVTVIKGTTLYSLGENVVEVLRVMDKLGIELPINRVEYGITGSVVTPTLSTIKVKDVEPQVLTVTCKMAPTPIELVPVDILGEYEPSLIETELPRTYLEALLYFVASRVFNPVGLESAVNRAPFHTGNNYYSKYEAACALLASVGLDVEETVEYHKFSSKGFV